MIYDLSIPLNSRTVICPGDPEICIKRVVNLEDDGYNVTSLKMGTHTGTHVDLPLHAVKDGCDAASMPLELFCGEAVFVGAQCRDGNEIDWEAVDKTGIRNGDILVMRTGWEKKAGSQDYFRGFPYLTEQAASGLSRLGVKAIGLDSPSVDAPGSDGNTHRLILSCGIVIIEALVNLEALVGKRCFFSAVPLKIEQGDGSPVRAYARVPE